MSESVLRGHAHHIASAKAMSVRAFFRLRFTPPFSADDRGASPKVSDLWSKRVSEPTGYPSGPTITP